MKTKEMTKEAIEETNVKNETVNQWSARLPPEQQQFAFELWKTIHRADHNDMIEVVDPPAVAIGLAGQGKTRGTAALVNTPVCTSQSIALIKGRTRVLDTGYLFHNLDGRYDELRTRSAGGGRAGLSRGILAKIPIALPDLPEQTRIAAAMDTLDETIANIL